MKMGEQSASARMVLEISEGKENPFHTLEALREHTGMLWTILAKTGVNVRDDSDVYMRRPKGKPGEMVYHLRAVDEYAAKVFQYFAALEHDLYLASDGDKEAFKRMQQRLRIIAEKHQKDWDAFKQ
jgi:hypothetical protein